MQSAVQLSIRNDLEEIARATAALDEFCTTHGVPPRDAYHFDLAFDELLTNVISYAFDDDAMHTIQVRLRMADGTLEAEIEDDGKAFDPLAQAPTPDLDAEIDDRRIGGLGVHFVRTFMDEARYYRDGGLNRLVFSKKLETSPPIGSVG